MNDFKVPLITIYPPEEGSQSPPSESHRYVDLDETPTEIHQYGETISDDQKTLSGSNISLLEEKLQQVILERRASCEHVDLYSDANVISNDNCDYVDLYTDIPRKANENCDCVDLYTDIPGKAHEKCDSVDHYVDTKTTGNVSEYTTGLTNEHFVSKISELDSDNSEREIKCCSDRLMNCAKNMKSTHEILPENYTENNSKIQFDRSNCDNLFCDNNSIATKKTVRPTILNITTQHRVPHNFTEMYVSNKHSAMTKEPCASSKRSSKNKATDNNDTMGAGDIKCNYMRPDRQSLKHSGHRATIKNSRNSPDLADLHKQGRLVVYFKRRRSLSYTFSS